MASRIFVLLTLLVGCALARQSAENPEEESCADGESGCDASHGDYTSLLQAHNTNQVLISNRTSCDPTCMTDTNESQVLPLLKRGLVSDVLGWWNMPAFVSREKQEKLRSRLTPVDLTHELSKSGIGEDRVKWFTFGHAPAAEAAKILYEGSKLEGIFEHVPRKLQGVFWLRGDDLAEELVTMQYSEWFEDSNILIQPEAPFMYSFAYGTPWSQIFNRFYTINESKEEAAGHALWPTTLTYKFGQCPIYGKYCHHEWSDMAYGNMQYTSLGQLDWVNQIGDQVLLTTPSLKPWLQGKQVTGAWSLQAMSDDGSLWKRTVNYGFDGCDCFESTASYDYTKIIDGDGNPIEPWFSQFVEYMGDVPILMWSGFKSPEAEQSAREYYGGYGWNTR